MLKTRDGFVQGFNGQIAVDGHRQIITAQRLTSNAADYGARAPLVDDTVRQCGRRCKAVSADAGFCNEAGQPRRLGRARHRRLPDARPRPPPPTGDTGRRRIAPGSLMAAMDARLRRAGRRSRYRPRKQIVEPVFGQIKAARGFRRFSLRGFAKIRHEWAPSTT